MGNKFKNKREQVKSIIDSKLLSRLVDEKNISKDELEEVIDIERRKGLRNTLDGAVIGSVATVAIGGLVTLVAKKGR